PAQARTSQPTVIEGRPQTQTPIPTGQPATEPPVVEKPVVSEPVAKHEASVSLSPTPVASVSEVSPVGAAELAPKFCNWRGTVHRGGTEKCPTVSTVGGPATTPPVTDEKTASRQEQVPPARESRPSPPAPPPPPSPQPPVTSPPIKTPAIQQTPATRVV